MVEKCPIVWMQFWLPRKKRMTAVEAALCSYKGNIFGFDVLAGKQWCLLDGRVWSFGSRWTGVTHVRILHVAPLLLQSKVTHISQYPLPTAAKWSILEVINLEKREIISHTHSPYNSSVWPVCKPDGQWWITIDYQRLNNNTPPLTAAVPNI